MASGIPGGGVQAYTDALQKELLCFPTHEPGKQTQTEPILMSVWLPSLQFSLHVCVQTKYLGHKRTYMVCSRNGGQRGQGTYKINIMTVNIPSWQKATTPAVITFWTDEAVETFTAYSMSPIGMFFVSRSESEPSGCIVLTDLARE